MSLLELDSLTVRYRAGRRSLTAVDGVSIDIPSGAIVGLVGESGCGKSSLARALVGLAPVSSGRVVFDGVDTTPLRGARRRALTQQIQLVFQDPYSSLDPRMTVAASLREALTAHQHSSRSDVVRETHRLLELIGLDPDLGRAFPRQLSGGQRQRVAIARALAVEPRLLIADEITSALDASVQGSILNLVNDLRAKLGLTVLFISHNLAAVRYLSDIIAVMYLGQLVEIAPVDELLQRPQHPYTRALLAAVPRLDDSADDTANPDADTVLLDQEPPDPHVPPSGCRFHTRCPVGPLVDTDRDVCRTLDPIHEAAHRLHRSACHFSAGLAQTADVRSSSD